VGARAEKRQVQKGQRSIAKKKPTAVRPAAATKTSAKFKPSSATKAKAAASKEPAANKRAAAKPKAHAKGITPTKGRPHANTAPTKGRPPAKSKAKKTTRGIQKKAPAARVVSAKPVAPKAPAAPGLRRNTTLQTRGKQVAGGLRPKSRTTGAAVAEAANAAANAAAGSKRTVQAETAAPANKCAKNTPASHCTASAPNAAASAAQPRSLSKARPSPPPHSPPPSPPPPPLRGAAANAAASGKTSQVGPHRDKGKAPIAKRDNGSKPAYGLGSAQETGAVASLETSHITAEIKQYHNYSHQGSRSLLRFVCAGDRREKVRPACSLFVDDAWSARVFLLAL
jgi:hypothetical protein